jgi:glycerol-3-phosphate dehydrogenase
VTLFGTTDVDHDSQLQTDPSISSAEVEYLFAALGFVFPELQLTPRDVISTYSGLRPVVNTGKANPSKESREHAIWDENGLLTVSGGKLTTFRPMARDAFKAVRKHLGHIPFDADVPVLDALPPKAETLLAGSKLPAAQQLRLLARYGSQALPSFSNRSRALPTFGQNYARRHMPRASFISMICCCAASASVCFCRTAGSICCRAFA